MRPRADNFRQAQRSLVPADYRTASRAMLLLLLLTAHGSISSATALDKDYSRTGVYFGAGLSIVDERFDAFEGLKHDADEIRPGLNLRVGYRFHPRFAAELSLQTYSGFRVEFANAADAKINGRAVSGNIKAYFSDGDRQAYALLGLGSARTDNDSGVGGDGSDRVKAIGFGADYYLDRDMALYLELVYYQLSGDTDGFDFAPLTAGLAYRF